jgi:hypothetical protein
MGLFHAKPQGGKGNATFFWVSGNAISFAGKSFSFPLRYRCAVAALRETAPSIGHFALGDPDHSESSIYDGPLPFLLDMRIVLGAISPIDRM